MIKEAVIALGILLSGFYYNCNADEGLDRSTFKIAGRDVVLVTTTAPSPAEPSKVKTEADITKDVYIPKKTSSSGDIFLPYYQARNRGIAEKKTVLVCKGLSGESLDNQIKLAQQLGYLLTVVGDDDVQFPVGCTKYVCQNGDLVTAQLSCMNGQCSTQQCLNGQCPTSCANGQCNAAYQPMMMQMGGCSNGSCGSGGCSTGNCSTGRSGLFRGR